VPKFQTAASAAACAFGLAVATTPAKAQSSTGFVFALPAEPLAKALRDVSARTGRNVIAPDALVAARQAPPLSGTFTAEQAVARLLQGTGLQSRMLGGTLVVEAVPPAARAAGSEPTSAITVTGTRIRGAGSTSPVTVTTRRDLEQAGISDLADFTRILPQNYTGGQNRGIAGGGEQGGQSNLNNSATLNLRGLGPDATLTLVNGHRLSYDAVDQGIDISAIPLGAIERVEVVSDGASALYGSDAVAGVANIILRRDYEGLETTIRAGGATDGGDVQREYSLVGGHRWTSGGFMVALDRSSATAIYAGQRDYARTVDPSLTLSQPNRQLSGVLAFHQQLTPTLSFEADGNAMRRRSMLQNPFSPTADVHVSGLADRVQVTSYALTPSLRADLGSWQATLSATGSDSRTFLDARNYSNGVARRLHLLYEDNLKGIEANAEGRLVELPGGDARLAVGAGVRRLWLHDRYLNVTGSPAVTVHNFTESRNVQFAYGELSLPLAGPDLHLPLIHRLTVTAALRHEHWNGIASVTTPKIGLIYEPGPDLSLRATWGRSFKIPTLDEINEPEAGGLYPSFYFTPPPQPAGSPVLIISGSAPALRPEQATSWSATAGLKPRFVAGLSLQVTYFHVDYRDRIADPLTTPQTALYNPLYDSLISYDPTAAEVNAVVAALPGGLYNFTGAPFDPSAIGAIIDTSARNTERQRIHGVDVGADYKLDLSPGSKLLLTGAASYLYSGQQLVSGQALLPLAGTIFNPPHWRGRAGAVWDGRRASFSAFVNYVGSTIDNRFTQLQTVAPFVTLDLSASVRTRGEVGLLHNVELRLSALNMLNQKPHHVRNQFPEEAPYDSTNESSVGRFIGASVRKMW
jgi:outer membrane receptor protein involved in Fe transport